MMELMPEDMKQTITAQLRDIEQEHGVRILFAVESGSRAWGFPSPDSDFDARFVYARPADWYLSLAPGRDVIELPIVGDLDINGWDIRKALSLLLKPNPVLLEWLSSPLRYLWDDQACAALHQFAEKLAHRPACLHHYTHLGNRQWQRHIESETEVSLKKYFYVLRPAMVLAWLRQNQPALPPMSLQELMAPLTLPDGLAAEITDLIARKAETRELGQGPRLPRIDRFIADHLDWAMAELPLTKASNAGHRAEADALFRSLIQG